MSASKQGYSPRTVTGVSFFNHFPRQRLRPYGEIKEATADNIMVEKANIINCEYLSRPNVALSELADTVTSNKDMLKEMLTNLDIHAILAKVEQLDQTAKMFNSRVDLPVKSSDVHRLLKYAIDDENDTTDKTFDEMEHLGMILYVIGCHQKQLRALVRSTADYSKKCQDLPAKHEFKINPGLKSLKEWWSTEAVTEISKPSTISATYRRNLLAELGSDTDSDEDGKSNKDKKGKGKGKKRPAKELSISSLSSTDLSDDDDVPPPKPSPRKRKSQQTMLSDQDIADAGPSGESNWEPSSSQTESQNKRKSKPKKAKKKKDN